MGIAKSQSGGGTDHFLGTYETLGDLQTAHPTATLGDYAYVEALPSEDLTTYYWDGSNWDDGIDPSQFLQSGLNLSDLGNKKIARQNIGVDKRTARGDADYSILSTDKYIGINVAFTAIRTFTLPAANVVNAGFELIIQDEVGAIQPQKHLLITRSGSDTINGRTTIALCSKYGSYRLTSNGTDAWFFKINESRQKIISTGDVTNTATDTLADITELTIPVFAGVRIKFRFNHFYDSSSTAVGSRWSINYASGSAIYQSMYPLSTTTQTINRGLTSADLPAAANGTSAATSGNIAVVEGDFIPVSDGTIVARFAREGAAGTITSKAGSYVEWEDQP